MDKKRNKTKGLVHTSRAPTGCRTKLTYTTSFVPSSIGSEAGGSLALISSERCARAVASLDVWTDPRSVRSIACCWSGRGPLVVAYLGVRSKCADLSGQGVTTSEDLIIRAFHFNNLHTGTRNKRHARPWRGACGRRRRRGRRSDGRQDSGQANCHRVREEFGGG